jgi:hypothetical protein
MSPDFRSGGKTRIIMTENDKNDLKVPHQAGQDLAYAAFGSCKENCQGCSDPLEDGARE